jgi:ribonucleases P/MRP protein subunit RPP40
MDILTKLLANKESFDMLLLDFENAFDKVSHKRLNLKLSGYGITGKLLNWLKAFLSNRKQRVVMGDVISEWVEVNSGVIQGSVLGPLLFILFINDLIDQIKNNPKVFADDTKSIAKLSENNPNSNFQNDINNVLEWTNVWLMRLNLDKCKVMHLSKKNPKTAYIMRSYENNESKKIEITESQRDLGIQVSSNLKYADQVSKASSKANSVLGMLKRTFVSRNKEIWKKLWYCALYG